MIYILLGPGMSYQKKDSRARFGFRITKPVMVLSKSLLRICDVVDFELTRDIDWRPYEQQSKLFDALPEMSNLASPM